MERYLKIVQNLPRKQRMLIIKLGQRIEDNDLEGMKLKKLQGFDNYYATRKGKIRIVFSKKTEGNKIINIDYRKTVYRKF